jgi:hypothetical protein
MRKLQRPTICALGCFPCKSTAPQAQHVPSPWPLFAFPGSRQVNQVHTTCNPRCRRSSDGRAQHTGRILVQLFKHVENQSIKLINATQYAHIIREHRSIGDINAFYLLIVIKLVAQKSMGIYSCHVQSIHGYHPYALLSRRFIEILCARRQMLMHRCIRPTIPASTDP